MISILIIVIIVLGAAMIIVSAIFYKMKSERTMKNYSAAEYLLKNEHLDETLTNHIIYPANQTNDFDCRKMINIKSCRIKPKLEYLFCPRTPIVFGRNKEICNVMLSDETISARHCLIVELNGVLYLQDCNSANGTLLKRGILKKYLLQNMQIEIRSNDKIVIGNTTFKIKIFEYHSVSI